MSNNETVAADAGAKEAQPEHQEFLGYDDPHKAALEDNPEKGRKANLGCWLVCSVSWDKFHWPYHLW